MSETREHIEALEKRIADLEAQVFVLETKVATQHLWWPYTPETSTQPDYPEQVMVCDQDCCYCERTACIEQKTYTWIAGGGTMI